MNANEKFRDEVISLVSRATKLKKKDIQLEKPPEGLGDLAFPCFSFAKKKRKDPKKMAADFFKKIKKSKLRLIHKIEQKGPYINFFADFRKTGNLVLSEIIRKKDRYGSGKKTGKKILIEHTSANPDGPLHLGHFRNSAIGDSITRIMSFTGNSVPTISWLNDSGRQIAIAVMEYIFNKTKPAKDKPDWWVLDLYLKGNERVKSNPDLEKNINDIIKRFESRDKKTVKDFYFITNECIRGHKQTLANLGIRIDEFFKDSKPLFDGSTSRILNKIKNLSQGKVSGKRIWVDLKQFGIDREFTLTRSDGTTIYPARDLAFHEHKFKKADLNLNIIGTDQKFYFKQLNSTLSLLFPERAKKYKVVFYEFLLLPGGTMSTRAGKFVAMDTLLENALKEAKKTVSKKMPKYSKRLKEEIAKKVGLGALKYAMLKVSPEKTYAFNIPDTLKFEGDTAPYIQYTHARCCSILRKGKIKKIPKFDSSFLKEEKEKRLVKILGDFPEVVSDAARDYRPHYIANYAYKLATVFNEFYQKLPVLRAKERKVKNARLAAVRATQIVLENSLALLGIESPERM